MLFEEFFYDRTKAISLSGFCVHNYFKLVSCLSGTLAVDFMNGAFRTTEVKEHWGLLMNISRIVVTPFSQETNPLLFYNGSLSYFFVFGFYLGICHTRSRYNNSVMVQKIYLISSICLMAGFSMVRQHLFQRIAKNIVICIFQWSENWCS